MGDEVEVISKCIVRPESYDEESDRVKIHLTPWDLFFLRAEYPQRGLLFPQPDPETHMISQLKSSLSVALKIFYPFAGRLVKIENEDDGTASFYVDCNGSGVKFVHASAKTISVILVSWRRRKWKEFQDRISQAVSERRLEDQTSSDQAGIWCAFSRHLG